MPVTTTNTRERYLETVKLPENLDKDSLDRYQKVSSALSKLLVVREIFSEKPEMRKFYQGDDLISGLHRRKFNLFGEYDDDTRFTIDIRRIIGGYVVNDSPPGNVALTTEQYDEQHYQVLVTNLGVVYRVIHWNNENIVRSPQTLVNDGNLPNALKAFTYSADAVSDFIIKNL